MPDHFSDAPATSDGSDQPGATDSLPFRRLAQEEAEVNRRELAKLYSDCSAVIGELRYHLLWRLSEIARICNALQRTADTPPDDPDEVERLRERTSRLALQAVQMRQEARLMLNAYEKATAKTASATSTRRLRLRTMSGRQIAVPEFSI